MGTDHPSISLGRNRAPLNCLVAIRTHDGVLRINGGTSGYSDEKEYSGRRNSGYPTARCPKYKHTNHTALEAHRECGSSTCTSDPCLIGLL